ncbi:hypothetical protein ADK86_11060 [Streptomyces sp. NRRL F-5755]|nr:hypothetical protein ADK86_11060 [Streptomyces sp. NRRL F-5755]
MLRDRLSTSGARRVVEQTARRGVRYAASVVGPERAAGFPGPDERAIASCSRHRVLSSLPLWDGCFLCHR